MVTIALDRVEEEESGRAELGHEKSIRVRFHATHRPLITLLCE